MNGFGQDLRFAFRGLLRNPGFTAVAVVTLALVIGTNTAAFSIVRGVIFRPVEVTDIDRLVAVTASKPGEMNPYVAPGVFADWQKDSRSFSGLAASYTDRAILSADVGPEQVSVTRVTADFFPVLGARTVVGSTFGRAEVEARNDALVVISHGLWTRLFAQDPRVVGKSIRMGDGRLTIAGVMSGDFAYPPSTDAWIPLKPSELQKDERASPVFRVVGRLQPGVEYDGARAELQSVHDRLKSIHPEMEQSDQIDVSVFSLMDNHSVGLVLAIVMMASYVLLSIGCANMATQLLARAVNRRKEIASRISVGGSRGRIVRQLLTESVMLSLLGAGVGLLVAMWMLSLAKGSFSFLATLPGFRKAGLDTTTLIYTTLLAVGTGVVFGMVPAVQLARTDLNEVLKETGRGHTSGRATRRLRDALIVLQVTLAVVVTFGAATFVHMLAKIQREKGFQSDGLAYAQVDFDERVTPTYTAIDEFNNTVLGGLRKLPGVRSATLASPEPYSKVRTAAKVVMEGTPPDRAPIVLRRSVGADFFPTLGVPVLRGRTIAETDRDGGQYVAVVSESFAREIVGSQDPVGRRFHLQGETVDWNIVGMVADVEHSPGEGMKPTIYVPTTQWQLNWVTFVVRTDGDPREVVGGIRSVIGTASQWRQPISSLGTYEEKVAESTAGQRLLSTVTLVFGIIALLIAAVGLNGAVAFQVAERSNEIGVRMALGATPLGIVKAVLARGVIPLIIGVVLGVAAAKPTARFLSSLLAAATPETSLIVLAPAIVLVVALLGALIPTIAAAGRDPMFAFRRD